MALTDGRRIALVVVACILIWIGLIFKPVELHIVPGRRTSPPINPVTIAAGQLAQANDRWRLLELRDSIATVAAVRSGAGPGIFIDQSIPETIRDRLRTGLSSQWSAMVSQSTLPVSIAVIVDTAQSPHGHSRVSHFGTVPIETFLPSPETRGACIALAHLTATSNARMRDIVMQNLVTTETIASLLNPCALLAAFGHPGAHIADWLRETGWSEAKFADWAAAPTPWKAVVRPRADQIKALGGWLDGLGDPTWHIRDYVAPSGIACLAGEPGTCAAILLAQRRPSADSIWRASVVTSGGTSALAFYVANKPVPLGPAGGWVVSEMVRTIGRERFTRFWNSPLPVDSAFHEATGQTLDNWLRDWGQRAYGRAAVGPSISVAGLLTGAVILVLTIGASIAVELRRRVA